ncbi:putative dehydrogenase [Anaerobacterium chartisolvens]|uniref:Putative dehydrogenase n=1 Tax=Anaerobacterium chartisolvens TaxID=1297424 RepID=A0A369AWZ5_9FIRM|nr:Gfo/Idh/MocA family oxidoreductase [Anaerobacterium chartisolvens]RCX12737.1 putative dehydrogenase [Anaerobacterium chartisolvens]
MQKIRLGVIGTGLAWERLHYPAILELKDKYEIAALSNRTLKDAQEFAKKIGLSPENIYQDYKEMLKRDDIDAVDILVPIEMNYGVSWDVAAAGIDFICEKPLAAKLDDAKKYVELSKKHSLKIMIAENYRYNEENNIIRSIIGSGKIGDVIYFIRNNITCFPCEMSKDTFAGTEWRQHPKFAGGAFLDAALHDIAAMRHIFGDIECVQAFGKPQQEDFNPYVSVNSNILFKNRITGYFSYFPSGMEPQRPLIGFRIFGTKGEIYLEEKNCGTINVAYNNGQSEQVPYTPERGYYNELMNFYNAFNGKEEILVTPEVEFGDVKAVFSIMESVSKQRLVYIEENQSRKDKHYIEGCADVNSYLQ